MRLLIVSLASIILFYTQAQTSESVMIRGKVINEKTKEPIPYANIGLLYTEIGTLSEEDGTFSIKVPIHYNDQDLLFSSIGYQKKSIPLRSISSKSTIRIALKEEVTTLEEVTIVSEKFKKKTKVLGNGKPILPHGNLVIDSLYSGAAYALLINKRAYPELTYVHTVSLRILKNLMPSFKIRMRILAVDSSNNNQPGDDLIPEQMIQESTIRKGWVDFKLPKEYLLTESAFYIAFEWILTQKDRKYIGDAYREYMKTYPDRINYDTIIIEGEEVVSKSIGRVVSGTIFSSTYSKKDRETFACYARDNSFGKWERSSSILSAKIELANYPLDTSRVNAPTPVYSIVDSIDTWAQVFKEEQNIPGFQLAIMKGDQLIYSNAFGYSDKQEKIKVNPQTQFRIASISKPLTSAGIMKLVSEGKIDPDQPIQQYVPSFPKKEYPITTRQLLGHLGGLRDYYGVSWEEELFIQQHFATATDALSLFSNDPIVAEPGTQFIYSPFGYMLLGAVIEGASGKSYLDYMKQTVWEPLNMNFTYGEIADSTMEQKSKFYFYTGEEATPYDLSYSYPTGGLLSTAENLVTFGSVLSEGNLIEESLLEQIFNPQATTDGIPTGYGLGWYVGKDFNEKKVWYHAGELPSSGSMLLIYPEEKISIAFLANSPILTGDDEGFSKEVQELGGMVYKHQEW